MWELTLVQDTTDQSHGQPYNVAVRALDPGNETRRETLDCVGAGAIDGLSRRDVPRDVFICHLREPHTSCLNRCSHAARADQRHTGMHVVYRAAELAQHANCVVLVGRLAEDLTADCDRGISA